MLYGFLRQKYWETGRRLCVNPDHLSFGSAIENAADKKMHGTTGKKLTMKQANEIRLLYKSGNYKQVDLSKNMTLAQILSKILFTIEHM